MIFDELRAIQRQHGYLPADELKSLSKSSGIPLYHLQGVASFYPHFYLQPPARVNMRVCADMSCHLRGAVSLCKALKQRFPMAGKDTVAVQETSCLGQCDGAPAISINDVIYREVTALGAEGLAQSALEGSLSPPPPARPSATRLASDPYEDGARYGALRRFIATRDWEGVLKQLKESGLVGLGGAGFPAGTKWEIVRHTVSAEKYVVCNADESEPGTIKDRFILSNLPHLVVEGMILAGVVTGAQRGYLYIRHEYSAQEKAVQKEIQGCYREGLAGSRILGSELAFDLEVFVSPGGYICGEESALLEAMEGKRAEPRNKPPFPVTHGLWNKPTVLNNVETFANVPQILSRGVAWYKSQGRGGCAGLKFVGVSGHVRHPGVFEIPMGTPAREVIMQQAGGILDSRQMKAFAPSGPSSGYLPAAQADVPLDFKSLAAIGSMLGSGAIVVCAEGTCMLDMALNSTKFFRNESCGKCVPCRLGSEKMVEILSGWTEGKGAAPDFQLVDDITHALKTASICGLGQFAHMPITSILAHFRDEVEAHVFQRRCPEGVCPMRESPLEERRPL